MQIHLKFIQDSCTHPAHQRGTSRQTNHNLSAIDAKQEIGVQAESKGVSTACHECTPPCLVSFHTSGRGYSISAAAESKAETFSRDRRHAVQGTGLLSDGAAAITKPRCLVRLALSAFVCARGKDGGERAGRRCGAEGRGSGGEGQGEGALTWQHR